MINNQMPFRRLLILKDQVYYVFQCIALCHNLVFSSKYLLFIKPVLSLLIILSNAVLIVFAIKTAAILLVQFKRVMYRQLFNDM